MRTVNVLIFLLALAAALQSLRLFVLDRTSVRSTVFWTGLWLAVGVFGLYPHFADYLMGFLQMESRTFFIVVVAVFVLFRLEFKSSEEREQMGRRIGRLAQEVALLRSELERKQDAPAPQDAE